MNRLKQSGNLVFPQNFHTKKSGEIAVSFAVIEKRFQQVLVDKNNHNALRNRRFIWRNSANEQFEDIQMNVHLFGKVVSPCCCIWTLNKTASDNVINIIDRAKEAINNNFYMDDHLNSFHDINEVMKVSNDVTGALKEEGFCLTKWISNDQHILEKLPSQELSLGF